jgi:hypothetical protein
MYQVSRAIFRELAPYLSPSEHGSPRERSEQLAARKRELLRCCEQVIERLATDPYSFSDPTRTLFNEIRGFFPLTEQRRVWRVVTAYMGMAERYVAEHPLDGYAAVTGEPPRCRATTRKGEPCRRLPLPHNGYCPSHQHLAETEEGELPLLRLREKGEAALAAAGVVNRDEAGEPLRSPGADGHQLALAG